MKIERLFVVFLLFGFIFAYILAGMVYAEDLNNLTNSNNENTNTNCHNLYWMDRDNTDCGYKEFCGAFNRPGLLVYSTESECKAVSKVIKSRNQNKNTSNQTIVGGDKDEHGCIGSAGYSWCEEKQKCLRIWEENCSSIDNKECSIDSDCELRTVSCKNKCAKKTSEIIKGDITCKDENINKTIKGCKCKDNKCAEDSRIKIMPETASARAIERLGQLGFIITLKEVPVSNGNNETKPVYNLEAEKQGKMFGLFKIKGNVSIEVDAQTGDVMDVKKPWWAFLASGI